MNQEAYKIKSRFPVRFALRRGIFLVSKKKKMSDNEYVVNVKKNELGKM